MGHPTNTTVLLLLVRVLHHYSTSGGGSTTLEVTKTCFTHTSYSVLGQKKLEGTRDKKNVRF